MICISSKGAILPSGNSINVPPLCVKEFFKEVSSVHSINIINICWVTEDMEICKIQLVPALQKVLVWWGLQPGSMHLRCGKITQRVLWSQKESFSSGLRSGRRKGRSGKALRKLRGKHATKMRVTHTGCIEEEQCDGASEGGCRRRLGSRMITMTRIRPGSMDGTPQVASRKAMRSNTSDVCLITGWTWEWGEGILLKLGER